MTDDPDDSQPIAPTPAMRQRLRLWAIICMLFGLYSWLVFFSTFHFPGRIGLNYNAPGTDWMVYYQAARDLLAGDVRRVFDPARFSAQLNAVFAPYLSQPLGFRPWLYPPHYLLYLAPFGLLSFRWSYGLFLILGFIGMSAAALAFARGSMRRYLFSSLLLNPATSITVTQGQNAFMTTGLLLGGLKLTRTRPIVAGMLFGLLSYKPQLCLMLPVALIAERRWRVLAAAAVTALLLIGASIPIVGLDAWRLWLDLAIAPPADFAANFRETNLLFGVSLYVDCLLLHLPSWLAGLVQLSATGFAGICVARTFRRDPAPIQRLGVLLPATLLAAPYVALYDLLPLGIAATWLVRRAAGRDESGLTPLMLGVAAWSIPLMNPPIINAIGFATPFLALFVMLQFMAGETDASVGVRA